jgi:NADPH:quinone reductase
MRAVQIDEFGGPEVLKVVDIPKPEPGNGQALIEVSRVGMNFADTHQRENSYLTRYEVPLVLGGEVAGKTEDGRRVIALLASGGYAEYAVAPKEMVHEIPEGVEDGAALALLTQGITAWHLFKTSAKLAPGEAVVVISGAGGVGSLAVQLAKPFGAGRVIATASTEEKRALALSLGADAVVDPAVEDLRAALIEANGGNGVDVVLEMSGGRVFSQSAEALAPFGRIVAYGIAGREQNTVETGATDAKEPCRRRLLADALPGSPGHDGGAPGGPVRARRARRARPPDGRDLRALRRAPGPRGHAGPKDERQGAARPVALGGEQGLQVGRDGVRLTFAVT